MIEEIFEAARGLGHVSPEDEAALRVLCGAAMEELAPRLKRGVTPEDCAPAFTVAAALVALSARDATTDGVVRFTAGDLTIQAREGHAGGLRAQALRVLSPYLADDGFSFVGVRG